MQTATEARPNTLLNTETLQKLLEIRQRIDQLTAEAGAILAGGTVTNGTAVPAQPAAAKRGRPAGVRLSPEAKKRIALAQKKRWAKFRADKNSKAKARKARKAAAPAVATGTPAPSAAVAA